MARIAWLAGCAALLSVSAAVAQAPPAPGAAKPKPKPQAAADPSFDAAKAGFEALPEAERKGLQDALVWTGDYNSVVTGAFGRRTYDALISAQKRGGGPETGLPDAKARAAILAAGEAARKTARFVVKPDPASGAVIGAPERLLPKRSGIPGGTRWQSADGRVTLDTKSSPPGETDLDALFARATAPAPDRKVTYKIKRPDFLVVTGETATGKYYIRHAAGAAGIRGFTLGYDKALAPEIDRIVIAVANSFTPFPEAAQALVPALAPSPAPQAISPVAIRPAPLPGRGAAPTATGLLVAPGRVLTSATALDGCASPRIEAAAARVVKSDAGRGLALLETGPLAGRSVAAPAPRAASAGDALVVLGADADKAVSVAPGEAGAGGARVFAPLQPGAAGAPAFDRSGSLVGVVARFPAAPRLVAGVAPPMSHPLVSAGAVEAFLAESGIALKPAAASPATLGAVAGALAGAVVGITCGP